MKSLENRYQFYVICFLGLLFMGLFLSLKLPVSLYPQVQKTSIRVIIPILEDNERFYQYWGEKIEASLLAIEGAEDVEATYRQGRVIIYVNFKWNIEARFAKREVSTVAALYQSQFPTHWPAAAITYSDPGSENYIAVSSDKYDSETLTELLKAKVLPQLEQIEGVDSAWISSKGEKFLSVELRPRDIINFDLNLSAISKTLYSHANNQRMGLLATSTDSKTLIVADSAFGGLEPLREIIVGSYEGIPIRLADVANVDWIKEEQRRAFYYNNEEVIAVAIWPEPGANIYEISTQFQEIISSQIEEVGNVVVLNSPLSFIQEALFNIFIALLIGILATSLLVFLFYRSLSVTLLVSLSMPMALCMSFILMKFFDVGINLISLGAMSIAVGMVVDSTVIVIERIKNNSMQGQAVSLNEIILQSLTEVRPVIMASTATSVIVFLPLAFTDYLVSSLLRDIVMVTISILLSSVLISLILIPSVYMLFAGKMIDNTTAKSTGLLIRMQNWIGNIMDKYTTLVDNRNSVGKGVIISILLLSVAVIALTAPNLKTEVIAQPRPEIVDIDLEFQREDLSQAAKQKIFQPVVEQIEALSEDYVKHIYLDVRPSNVYISLHLKSYAYSDKVITTLKEAVKRGDLPNVGIEPWVTSSLKYELPPSIKIAFNSLKEDKNRLYMQQIMSKFSKELWLKKSEQNPRSSKQEITHLAIDYDALNVLASNADYYGQKDNILNFAKHAIEPQKLYDVNFGQGNKELKLSVKSSMYGKEGILDLPIKVNEHEVFLQEIITMSDTKAWREFYSHNTHKQFEISLWLALNNSEIEQFKQQIINFIKETNNTDIVPIIFEDTMTETHQALSSTYQSFAFSVILVFLILLYQFHKVGHVLIILSIVPVAIAGSTLFLYLFGSTLSINSMLGILILVGLSINNSILLVDAFERMRKQHVLPRVAAGLCVKNRLSSMLVTNCTTVVAMMPLVIGFGPGKDVLQPLGISLAFGLLTSTIAAMLIIPVLLILISKHKQDHTEEYDIGHLS